MGYISTVTVVLSPKGHEAFKDFRASLAEYEAEELEDFMDEGDVARRVNGCLTIKWEDVKWYESRKAVCLMEDFMDKLDKDEDVKEYSFLRVGEEAADVEERGAYWGGGYRPIIKRTIVFLGDED